MFDHASAKTHSKKPNKQQLTILEATLIGPSMRSADGQAGHRPFMRCVDGQANRAAGLAMLLANYGSEKAVKLTIANNFGDTVANSGYTVTVACPSHFGPAQKQAVADACAIAGLPLAAVVPGAI